MDEWGIDPITLRERWSWELLDLMLIKRAARLDPKNARREPAGGEAGARLMHGLDYLKQQGIAHG